MAVKQAETDEQNYGTSLLVMVHKLFTPYIGGELIGTGLRSDAMLASRRTAAFAYMECFSLSKKMPWRLTQGDIQANIHELLDAGANNLGEDGFAKQLRTALACGMSFEAAKATLELLRDAPCTTDWCEQAHGLAASSMGAHSGHGQTMLPARSIIHQARAAFTAKSDDSDIAKIDEKIQKLEGVQSKRFGCHELAVQKLSQVSRRI